MRRRQHNAETLVGTSRGYVRSQGDPVHLDGATRRLATSGSRRVGQGVIWRSGV